MSYSEIIKREIGENKNIVVSKREDGKFSVAQQIVADSDGKEMKFFVKNAIVVDKDGLNSLVEALKEAQIKIN